MPYLQEKNIFKYLNFIEKYFINNNLLVAFCSLTLSIETFLLFKKDINIFYLIVIFFSTYIAYNFLRNHFINYFYLLVLFLSILILFFYFYITFFNLILLGILGIIVYLYYIKIRMFPFIKIFIVGFCWAIFTVFFPLNLDLPTFYLFVQNKKFMIYFIIRIIFISSLVIPFDIKDIYMDNKIGLKTIPSFLGEKKSKYIAILMLIFNIIILYKYNHFFKFIIINHIYTIFLLIFFNENKPDIYVSGLIESSMITELIFYFINTL
ncbi:MAG: hypothetical protein KatS3mg129_1098 [Leptospiraceae bacterium]|nr:MAG: hypothetical protein KatS3mg129_1098 [Leptospiraceae bacterium]